MPDSLFPPNMVRDTFWTCTIKEMFEACKEEEADGVEFVKDDYIVINPLDGCLVILRLPENAFDMPELELVKYLNTTYGMGIAAPNSTDE